MIGIIWNCRGVAKKGMGTCIKDLLLDFKADFVGLQETMRKKYTDKFFRKIDPHQNYTWHWLPSNGRSGGILCGVKTEEYEVIKVEELEFAVIAEVVDKKVNQKMRLVTVYGPAHDDKKEQFLTELSTICAKKDLPLMVGGILIY
jgi:exonuclease III